MRDGLVEGETGVQTEVDQIAIFFGGSHSPREEIHRAVAVGIIGITPDHLVRDGVEGEIVVVHLGDAR